MGTMIANAMGCRVTVISTSDKKETLAKKLGAEEYIISTNSDAMKKRAKSFDIILNTIGAEHDLMSYLGLLKKKGTMVMLGIVTTPLKVSVFPHFLKIIFYRLAFFFFFCKRDLPSRAILVLKIKPDLGGPFLQMIRMRL